MPYSDASSSMVPNCIVLHCEGAATHFNSAWLDIATVYDCIVGNGGDGICGKCISDIHLATAAASDAMVPA